MCRLTQKNNKTITDTESSTFQGRWQILQSRQMADDGLSVVAAPDSSFLLRVTKEANRKKAMVKRMFADFDPSKCANSITNL